MASSLTRFGEKLDVLAAHLLPDLLGIDPSSKTEPRLITRNALEMAIASPLRAKELRTLLGSESAPLISEYTVTDWTHRLVAACDGVYAKQGLHAYIEAVTDLIFDEGNVDGGLPGGIRDLCAMLIKNALEAGIAHGLGRQALQGLRNTVILRFLMGSVFVPHLRPTSFRELTGDASLYQFDRQLFKRFCDKTTEIIDIDAEAMVLLALSRQTKTSGTVQAAQTN